LLPQGTGHEVGEVVLPADLRQPDAGDVFPPGADVVCFSHPANALRTPGRDRQTVDRLVHLTGSPWCCGFREICCPAEAVGYLLPLEPLPPGAGLDALTYAITSARSWGLRSFSSPSGMADLPVLARRSRLVRRITCGLPSGPTRVMLLPVSLASTPVR